MQKPFTQSQLIEVRKAGKKGRGVFAREDIAEDTVIERVPVIMLRNGEVYGDLHTSDLSDYIFSWGDDWVGLSLGYASMYNHSYNPNAVYECLDDKSQIFTTLCDIGKGEEITINYNGEPANNESLWFKVKRS
jgi:SET domain-containing protein